MKKVIVFTIASFVAAITAAQNDFKAVVKEGHSNAPLPGATVAIPKLNKSVAADSSGKVFISGIPAGKYKIRFTYVGFVEKEMEFSFPQPDSAPAEVIMERGEEEEEEEEVIIKSTRSTRTFRDIPTRVEFIAGEELDEKSNMKPGDIRMVLTESTGIQTQQTSATSANASIRIQGLDGRYTQILKDGLPLFAGFSGGLGLLQTPPLDLQQFEVITTSWAPRALAPRPGARRRWAFAPRI